MDDQLPDVPQLFFSSDAQAQLLQKFDKEVSASIALAPSAAFALKRWPLEHFKKLIQLLPKEHFIVLGGPEDSFTQDLVEVAPDRVKNLAGELSLVESSIVVSKAKALVSNDTGLMHVAEQTGTDCVALMGPAPFGFPSRLKTRILEKQLSCRPCSKHGQGPCVNKDTFQKCLVDIKPMEVVDSLKGLQVLND
jgi:ADP-heptose:LPS heptosyltransferase